MGIQEILADDDMEMKLWKVTVRTLEDLHNQLEEEFCFNDFKTSRHCRVYEAILGLNNRIVELEKKVDALDKKLDKILDLVLQAIQRISPQLASTLGPRLASEALEGGATSSGIQSPTTRSRTAQQEIWRRASHERLRYSVVT